MDYQELIDDLRCRINPQYVDCIGTESYERKQCLDAIESLLAENERLNAELAKYRDAPVVGWQWLNTGTYRKNIKKAALYRDWRPLIVKPDENK